MCTSSRTAYALLAALLVAGCSDGPSEPDPGGNGTPTLRLTLAPAETDAVTQRVFARVDRVNAAVFLDGEMVLDATMTATPASGTVGWEWPLPSFLEGRQMTVKVEARSGLWPLFRGEGGATLQNGVVSASVPPLRPVPYVYIQTVPTMELGDTVPLSGYAAFATGDTIPGAQLAWEARSFSTPLVELLPGPVPRVYSIAEGSGFVRATYEGAFDVEDVQVHSREVSLTIEPDSVEARQGEVVRLRATSRDRRGNVIDRDPYVWSSADSTVAAVAQQQGTVRARAPGRTTIVARSGTLTDTAVIRVLPPPAAGASAPRR